MKDRFSEIMSDVSALGIYLGLMFEGKKSTINENILKVFLFDKLNIINITLLK